MCAEEQLAFVKWNIVVVLLGSVQGCGATSQQIGQSRSCVSELVRELWSGRMSHGCTMAGSFTCGVRKAAVPWNVAHSLSRALGSVCGSLKTAVMPHPLC